MTSEELIQQAASFAYERIGNAGVEAYQAQLLPSVLYRPRLFQDGNAFCCLLGDDIAIGVCGWGASPAEAVRDFDAVWYRAAKVPGATETPTTCEVCGAPFSIDDMGVKMLTGGHRHYRRCLNAHQKKELNNAD